MDSFAFLKANYPNAYTFKNLQKLFIQSFPLYSSCLCFIVLSDDIVEIKMSDGRCLATFVVDDFADFYLNPSILLI